MMQKKICILGTYAVGKTSLTDRFATSIFSERYRTTVGVHIQKKTVEANGDSLVLIIWDLAGEDEFVKLRTAYLRGASGYILVADGTRTDTLDRAMELQERAAAALGDVPFLLAINKADLAADWSVDEARLRELTDRGWPVLRTSAKTGHGVEAAFVGLANRMLHGRTVDMASGSR